MSKDTGKRKKAICHLVRTVSLGMIYEKARMLFAELGKASREKSRSGDNSFSALRKPATGWEVVGWLWVETSSASPSEPVLGELESCLSVPWKDADSFLTHPREERKHFIKTLTRCSKG